MPIFLCSEEALYREGVFVLPEDRHGKSSETLAEYDDFKEPDLSEKLSAEIQARTVVGFLRFLEAIFKLVNFLVTVLSKIV